MFGVQLRDQVEERLKFYDTGMYMVYMIGVSIVCMNVYMMCV